VCCCFLIVNNFSFFITLLVSIYSEEIISLSLSVVILNLR
jgi:hypothetical protein